MKCRSLSFIFTHPPEDFKKKSRPPFLPAVSLKNVREYSVTWKSDVTIKRIYITGHSGAPGIGQSVPAAGAFGGNTFYCCTFMAVPQQYVGTTNETRLGRGHGTIGPLGCFYVCFYLFLRSFFVFCGREARAISRAGPV